MVAPAYCARRCTRASGFDYDGLAQEDRDDASRTIAIHFSFGRRILARPSPRRSCVVTAHIPEMLNLRCVRVIEDIFRLQATAKTHQGSASAQRE
jgi:hypothetical protein